MNFSNIEDSVLEEKNRFNNFLSRFLKNSRVLVILLTAAVITAVSVSIWMKSPEYQILYNHLSKEDGAAIVNTLNEMKIPYKFTDISGQITVPKNQIDDIRLHLAEKNLPRGGSVGFELLDQEKFGISQFNEQINYQRALEGELSRTIKRINIIKDARIHIVLPKSSLFLQDKKKPSASVILELHPGETLNIGQINAILHLISTSIPNLTVDNITIIDQSGKLLNQTSLRYDQINDLQFKYTEEVESRYRNRIESILEPLLGFNNVHAQVTAQIDFNSQEKTQEKYAPNTNKKNQAIRSHQINVHDKIEKNSLDQNVPNSFSNRMNNANQNIYNKNNTNVHDNTVPLDSDINHEDTINYELNHSVSHTKINIGKVQRLSAAVIVNFTKDRNGKFVPLNSEKIKNIQNLVREAIGYSKSRGDTIHVVNAYFAKHDEKIPPITFHHTDTLSKLSDTAVNLAPWFLSALFFLLFLKKYICPVSKKNISDNSAIENHTKHTEYLNDTQNNFSEKSIDNDIEKDRLITQIANQNPRTIALIIRKWMSDKI